MKLGEILWGWKIAVHYNSYDESCDVEIENQSNVEIISIINHSTKIKLQPFKGTNKSDSFLMHFFHFEAKKYNYKL